MPTNVYFDTGTRPEQALYEDLIIEQLRIYGQDVYYIPRNMDGVDDIFGEDKSSSFDDAYTGRCNIHGCKKKVGTVYSSR